MENNPTFHQWTAGEIKSGVSIEEVTMRSNEALIQLQKGRTLKIVCQVEEGTHCVIAFI